MNINRECRECGGSFVARQHNALFCSGVCRTAFNNRRQQRGAEMYDFVMEMTITREASLAETLENLIASYLKTDHDLRAGRPSWQPIRIAKLRLPVVFRGEGDQR